MKHTPGPWTLIEGDDDGDVIVKMDDAHTVFIGNLEDTCTTCHANARLIAAAPRMYEYIEKRAADGDKEAASILESIHASR